MATTNSVTSSNTSTTTLSPFDITTNSTISFYNHQQNNCLNIPPVSTFIIPPTLPTQETSSLQNSSLLLPNIFINNSTTQQQQQQLLNVSETLPGLLASFLLNSGQNQSSPLCNLSASSLLSQQQQLIELLKQQSLQSSPSISQFQTIDFSSGQQRTPNVREAFEATALTNYQQLCRNSVIKPQLPPSAPQINSVNTLNIPPNFSNSPSLEQQLLLLLNLQQKPQNTAQHRSEPTVINCLERTENNLTSTHQIQQSTQQNSLDSFKDDKEYKNCSIRRSSSSVSYYKTCSNSNADVSEHFKRTFSGKWPKKLPSTSLRSSYIGRVGGNTKTNKEGIAIEEGREIGFNNYLTEQGEKREESFLSIKMEKRPSSAFKNEEILQKIQSGTNCHLRQKVGYTLIRRVNLTSEDKQVEEHFRKSLGDDKFKQIRSSQRPNKEEEEENGKMDDDDIEI